MIQRARTDTARCTFVCADFAWDRHCARETYLSLAEASAMAERLLTGARVFMHWCWRYTIVWDRGPEA